MRFAAKCPESGHPIGPRAPILPFLGPGPCLAAWRRADACRRCRAGRPRRPVVVDFGPVDCNPVGLPSVGSQAPGKAESLQATARVTRCRFRHPAAGQSRARADRRAGGGAGLPLSPRSPAPARSPPRSRSARSSFRARPRSARRARRGKWRGSSRSPR